MIHISIETHNKNCVKIMEVKTRNGKSILWLNMKNIQDQLCVKKNISDLSKKEQIREYKRFWKTFDIANNQNNIFVHEDVPLSIIMDGETPTAVEFKIKLGDKLDNIAISKEQSVLTKMIKLFLGERVLFHHYDLDAYKTDLYFLSMI